jgi:ParB/RepB/Spo0J family partition protein
MAKPASIAAVAAAPATPAPAGPARFEQIALERIDENPRNPRKYFDTVKLHELADSIREHGVVEPILVRPKGDRFEIVFGARRFRASKLGEQTTIPAIVRVMEDVDALETTVIENLQRADVHPLEEAEGYEQLLAQKDRKYTVDDLAAKVGKSKAYVYARLKLLALCKEARAAFYEGKLAASTALLVARIPGDELQQKALQVVGPREDGDAPSFREAARRIQQDFMLQLVGAPFPVDDAKLVPSAGACATCPKRTGSQPELFSDVASGDVCTDPACFKTKVDAAWRARAAAAKKAGRKVLEEDETAKVFTDNSWERKPRLTWQAEERFEDLDEPCFDDPKKRTWRELLGTTSADALVLARDPRGNVRELVPAGRASALLKKAGHEFKERGSTSSSSASKKANAAKDAAAKAKRELEDAIAAEVSARIATAAEKRTDAAFWRVVAQAFMDDGFVYSRRLGKKGTTFVDHGTRDKYLAKLDEKQLRGVIAELVFQVDFLNGDEEAAPILKWAGVDPKKVEAEVRAKFEPAAAEKKPSPAKKKGARRG